MKTEYVLGFMFHSNRKSVVLIRKEKPVWQQGLLNGVGGKIEEGETPVQAMVREFHEETGTQTERYEWRPFCELAGDDFTVHCFTANHDGAYLWAHSTGSEKIEKTAIESVSWRHNCVSNLPWLIELALDQNYGRPFYARVGYGKDAIPA